MPWTLVVNELLFVILPVLSDNELTFAPTFILLVTKALLQIPILKVLKLEAKAKFVEILFVEILHAVIKLVLTVPPTLRPPESVSDPTVNVVI